MATTATTLAEPLTSIPRTTPVIMEDRASICIHGEETPCISVFSALGAIETRAQIPLGALV